MPTLAELIERVHHDGQHDVGVPLESCPRCALDAKMAELAQPVELSAEDVQKVFNGAWFHERWTTEWWGEFTDALNAFLREKRSGK